MRLGVIPGARRELCQTKVGLFPSVMMEVIGTNQTISTRSVGGSSDPSAAADLFRLSPNLTNSSLKQINISLDLSETFPKASWVPHFKIL